MVGLIVFPGRDVDVDAIAGFIDGGCDGVSRAATEGHASFQAEVASVYGDGQQVIADFMTE